jgi:mono/diheme cytochrome c family protein
VVEPQGATEEGVILPLTRDAAVQAALLLLLGAAVFAVLAFAAWYRRRQWRRPALAGGAMAGLGAAAFTVAFTVAVNVPTYPVPFAARFAANPTPDTPETAAAGRATYERLCVVCHGVRGAGDGPAAFTMNPRPLDLNVHVPLHAPGEHFHWISEGIPGTAMPPWRNQLSETERWQLVRYLYTLAAER